MKGQTIKKIALVLIILIVGNVIMPLNSTYSAKEKDNSFVNHAGGVLIEAIKDLAVFLADTVLGLMQNTMFSEQSITITTDKIDDGGSWKSIATIIVGAIVVIAAVVVSVVASVLSAGGASPLLIAALAFAGKIVGLIGASVAVYGGLSARDELANTTFDIPFIRYTPFEIFSGQIPLLDVNFINPMPDIQIKHSEKDENGNPTGYWEYKEMYKAGYPEDDKYTIYSCDFFDKSFGYNEETDGLEINYEDIGRIIGKIDELDSDIGTNEMHRLYINDEIEGTGELNGRDLGTTLESVQKFLTWIGKKTNGKVDEVYGWCNDCDEYMKNHENFIHSYLVDITGYDGFVAVFVEIDSVRYGIMFADNDHNYKCEFNGGSYTFDMGGEMDSIVIVKADFKEGEELVTKTYSSSSGILQKSVATWYKALRRIALVALLTVLLYIGIRIILTSTAQDKAKYKKMAIDWVAAICILYILHFLIAGILAITSEISLIFGDKQQETISVYLPNATIDGEPIGENGYWVGSFVGYARLVSGYKSSTTSLSYALIYVMMVVYTVMFTFIYLKRVLYMAFLTMIAPLIALTYPIDKIKDGNAQAFGLWIREFIFNALLQPIHLILYVILIGNAMDLAVDYPLYAILALGFMVPAEKFLRKMFGFEKAGTVSQLGAAAGGALVGNALGKIGSLGRGMGNLAKGGRGQQGGAGAGGEGSSNEGGGNIRTVNNPVAGGNNADSGASGGDGSSGSGSSSSGTGGRNPSNDGPDNADTTAQATSTSTSWEDFDRQANRRQEAYNQANQNTLNSTPPRNIGKSTSKAGKYTGAGLKGLAQAGRYGVKAAGLAGKVVLGGAGAMIGAAAGIASGEGIGGALKYGAAGAMGGSALASGATNLATGAIDGTERLVTSGAKLVKDSYGKSKESKDAYNGIKDTSARDLARDMNLSPEVASLSYRIATSISGDALYDDNTLKKMIASSGADSATQKQMLEYIKKFR